MTRSESQKAGWAKLTLEQRKNRVKGMQEAARKSKTRSESIRKHWETLSEEERYERTLPGNIARSMNGNTPAARKKKSDSLKKSWSKLSEQEKEERFLKSSRQTSPSSIEIAICEVLDRKNISYQTQKWIGNWRVDIYLQKYKLIIECDGDYWHSLPHRIKRDKNLDQWCSDYDYQIIHIQERDIRKNPEEALKNSLMRLKYGE